MALGWPLNIKKIYNSKQISMSEECRWGCRNYTKFIQFMGFGNGKWVAKLKLTNVKHLQKCRWVFANKYSNYIHISP